MRVAALVLLAMAGTGCVERRLIVRSTPPGGLVLVDNRIVGVTPVTIPFTYYGSRTVEVRWDPHLEGVPPFRPVRETRTLYPPWYQWFPLDFLTEVVLPVTFVDERVFSFTLTPAPEPKPADVDAKVRDICQRAERLRAEAARTPWEGAARWNGP